MYIYMYMYIYIYVLRNHSDLVFCVGQGRAPSSTTRSTRTQVGL